MSQNKKDRIAPANIIALVGIAGIGVISCIGALLNTEDGSLTWPIIWSVIIMVVLGGLLCLAIFAKGENSHRELWTPVMWSSLGIYIIVAVFMCGPFLKFFFVLNDRNNLQEQARLEIENIEILFTSYETQRKDFLSNAETQLDAFVKSGYYGTEVLKGYWDNRVAGDIKGWLEDVAIPATDISAIKKLSEWKAIKSEINGWNYFELPKLAQRMKNLQELTWEDLNNRIETFGKEQELIPVIKGGQGSKYYIEGNAQFDLGEKPCSTFSSKLSQSDNVVTTLGITAYALLNLLVLFNLLVASTSKNVGPDYRGKETEGTTL